MIRLSGKVSRNMIIFIFLKSRVSQVTPKYGCHSQLMCHFKCLAYFLDLSARFFTSKIDRCTHSSCAEIPACLNGSKHDLIEFIWIGEELVVIYLDDKGDLMGVIPRQHTQ